MFNVISILVEQQPSKIGTMEKGCVEDSLEIATSIISKEASRMFQDVANGIDKNQTGERAVILFCQSRRICTKMP